MRLGALEHGRLVGDETTAHPTAPAQLAPVHGHYSPTYDPANFVATVEPRVLGCRGRVRVRYRTFERAFVATEFSPLEPQTEEKEYVAGVGEIREREVMGHHEEFRLVSVMH